jgi:signal peptidase II
LAGTLGNLYDRLVFGGVRDFLHFYWFQWPVFNVADCCLVCGAGLLLIQAFCMHQPAGDAATLSAKQANTDFAEIK